jgi:hypothetical protein
MLNVNLLVSMPDRQRLRLTDRFLRLFRQPIEIHIRSNLSLSRLAHEHLPLQQF